ncbi:hypothetical protein KC324_g64 [Hortaea werneckii]|nr:hypothetical protein KC324_g64 [Hortaea werneckii]
MSFIFRARWAVSTLRWKQGLNLFVGSSFSAAAAARLLSMALRQISHPEERCSSESHVEKEPLTKGGICSDIQFMRYPKTVNEADYRPSNIAIRTLDGRLLRPEARDPSPGCRTAMIVLVDFPTPHTSQREQNVWPPVGC